MSKTEYIINVTYSEDGDGGMGMDGDLMLGEMSNRILIWHFHQVQGEIERRLLNKAT